MKPKLISLSTIAAAVLATSSICVIENVRAQTERVLKNIAAILEAAGSSMGKAVRSGVFLKNMDDFAPARVAEQVPALKEMLDMRRRLTELMSKMEGNDKLEGLLTDVLSNTEKAMELAKQMQTESSAPETTQPEESK